MCVKGRIYFHISLIALLAVFLFVPASKADTIVEPNNDGTLIIPDGSVITDMYLVPDQPYQTYGVDFTFADGYGSEDGNYEEGDAGSINFTTPVSDLVVSLVVPDTEFYIFASTSPNGASSTEYNCTPIGTTCYGGELSFPGPNISYLSWQNGGGGYSGISSMSYTTPEPRTIVLLVGGLLGILALGKRRWLAGLATP